MLIELNILADVYGKPKEGSDIPTIIKKDIVFKKIFDTNQIKAEEYINERGKIIKGLVNIVDGEATYKAKHKYSDIVTKLKPIEVKGFLAHDKRKKNNKN